MKFFLDTEFCDREQLDQQIDLISIGLVADNGVEFYAELSDGWKPRHCNGFVHSVVLPLLDDESKRIARKECAVQLLAWLRQIAGNGKAEIVIDYRIDYELLMRLLREADSNYPRGCNFIEPYLLTDRLPRFMTDAIFDFVDELFDSGKYGERHHALNDARALRAAYLRVESA